MGRFSLNGNALMLNNKFVEHNNGVLSFQVSGTHFPYSNYENPQNPAELSFFIQTSFIISSSESNTATIDYGDGTILKYDFKSNRLEFNPSTPAGSVSRQKIHTYTDGNSQIRFVHISFSNPDKITSISSIYTNMHGVFPSEVLYLLNLSSISINKSKLVGFPLTLSSLINLKHLSLRQIGTAISIRIPNEFLNLELEKFDISASVNLSDMDSSNFTNFLNSNNRFSLKSLNISRCQITRFQTNISNLIKLEELHVGTNLFEAPPIELYTLTSLKYYNIGSGSGQNNIIKFWGSVGTFTSLITLVCSVSPNITTSLPLDMINCTLLKTIDVADSYRSELRINDFITNVYGFINANASKTGSNNQPFRGMSILTIVSVTNNSPSPTGIYQQPTGFILGSNNGSPASPKEMIWVLVNQYGHTITYTA